MTKFQNKFSLAHYDRVRGGHEDATYQMIKNADPAFRTGIHDIYFGKYFHYEFQGQKKSCGNAMGVEASDRQIDNLFRLQDDFGIEISLTFNTIEVPNEVVFDHNIRAQFVEWIGGFYDRGMRSCTISSTHIMRTGELQARCPDMRWKSTVNQICADAQQFVDYAYLGYNTILLDRNLNRNIKELRKIRAAQNYLNELNPKKKLLTSLLVSESCIYSCPFKKEHDSVGEVISTDYFRNYADLSCNGWRSHDVFSKLPRSGIDIVASDAKTFNMFADLTDVLKYSGRLTPIPFDDSITPHLKSVWYYNNEELKFKQPVSVGNSVIYANSFEEIIDNDLGPIHAWSPGWIDTRANTPDWRTTYRKYTGIWSTAPGKRLEKILTSCKNQCWDCHECERTFGMQDIDSALQIRKNFAPQ